MLEKLKIWVRRHFPSSSYAVIYDRWDEASEGWVDDMYEIFSSKEEAIERFNECYGPIPHTVLNPRIVKILEPIPGNWSTEY